MVTSTCFAQKDSAAFNTDTVRVGNFVIIKKNKGGVETQTSPWHDWDKTVDVKIERRPRKKSNISTNWWIMDLGFANFRDETNYANAQAGSYFKTLRPQDGPVNQNSYQLNTGKSSNVNIWLFMQKLNVYKHVVVAVCMQTHAYKRVHNRNCVCEQKVTKHTDPLLLLCNESKPMPSSVSNGKLHTKHKTPKT
jgi:hypothetical protein